MNALRQTTFLEESTEAEKRDAGIKLVLHRAGDEWGEGVEHIVADMLGDFTGEDIRLACEERRHVPHDPHAWGGVTQRLIKRGLIVATGEYRPMKARGSHARKTAVYRRT